MEVVGIKFKNNSKIYYFLPNNLKLQIHDSVVCETIEGKQIGTVAKEKIILETKPEEPLKNIIRIATKEDIETKHKLEEKKEDVLCLAKELIDKLKLSMKLVDVDFSLDGQKIIISYVCEDRVDFRELVKELASKLKNRIELKQIGIRDEAKVVGGIGICGQECCCKRYLNDFDKVSIKMAKNQNLSLNPTKISGVCGRLMCCLSYENNTYADAIEKMPKINGTVVTPDGEGIVVYNDLLNQKCTVKLNTDDVKIATFSVEDLKFTKVKPEQKNNATTAQENNIKDNKQNKNKNKKQNNEQK